jgi:hypothetical protein
MRSVLEKAVQLTGSGETDQGVTGSTPLERAADAHRVFENRAAAGKLVLAVPLARLDRPDDLRAGQREITHPHPDRVGNRVADGSGDRSLG